MKKISLIIIFVSILGSEARAKSQNNINKIPKVAFYKLHVNNNKKKFKYYSEIIPIAVSESIKPSNKYKFESIPVVKEFKNIPPQSENSLKHIKYLQELAKKNSADYVITGTCSLSKDALKIDLLIFNKKGKEYAYISTKSTEVGAILKNTIDDLSKKIEGRIDYFQEQNEARFKTSSVLTLYKGINFITFGIDMGRLYLLSSHKDTYKNSEFVNTYLLFNFTDFFGMSLNGEYFTLGQNDNIEKTYSMWSGIINLHFTLKFGNTFGISLITGGGVSRDEFILPNQPTFTQPQVKNNSTGGSFNAALSLNFNLEPIQLKIGSSYKKIYISSGNMKYYTLFFGIAYKI